MFAITIPPAVVHYAPISHDVRPLINPRAKVFDIVNESSPADRVPIRLRDHRAERQS